MSRMSLALMAATLIGVIAITFGASTQPILASQQAGDGRRSLAPGPTPPTQPSSLHRADTPGTGSTAIAASCSDVVNPAERRVILDSVRGTVERKLGPPIEFRVTTIRVCGSWAFMITEPQRPGGGTIHWNRTVCHGDTSHLVGALSQRDDTGAWRLVEYALCPSDVAWADWPAKYGVPEQILGF